MNNPSFNQNRVTVDTPIEEPQVDPQIEIINYGLKQLFSKKNIKLKTELTKQQVTLFARGDIISSYYNSKVLKSFLTSIMEHSVSIDRKGRQESIKIMQSLNSGLSDMDNDKSSITDALFNLRGRQ